jgi:hypothetical protein
VPNEEQMRVHQAESHVTPIPTDSPDCSPASLMSEENNEDDDAKEQSSLHIVGNGNDHWQRRGVRFDCHVNVFSRSYTSSLRACRSIKVAQKLADVASWQRPSSRWSKIYSMHLHRSHL